MKLANSVSSQPAVIFSRQDTPGIVAMVWINQLAFRNAFRRPVCEVKTWRTKLFEGRKKSLLQMPQDLLSWAFGRQKLGRNGARILVQSTCFFPLIWNGLKWWITSRVDTTTTCGKAERSIENKGSSFSSLKLVGKKRGLCWNKLVTLSLMVLNSVIPH